MAQELSISNPSKRIPGWLGISAIVVLYAALYTLNYWLPLENINYTSRIWNWSQTALSVGACVTLIFYWRSVTWRVVLLGLVLSALSAFSHWQHDQSLSWSLQEGLGVWVCFLAGAALFRDQKESVPALQPPLASLGKSVFFGMLVALPLAVINNLYFYMNEGRIQFQSLFTSAFAALSPAIHEEIIFRFFVLAFCLHLLKSSTARRWVMVLAVCISVIPHSLNHLPDLFLDNPVMGLFMLTVTSLLFGLPMALLQIKRNLESAIAFHWFIDFARFLFGF